MSTSRPSATKLIPELEIEFEIEFEIELGLASQLLVHNHPVQTALSGTFAWTKPHFKPLVHNHHPQTRLQATPSWTTCLKIRDSISRRSACGPKYALKFHFWMILINEIQKWCKFFLSSMWILAKYLIMNVFAEMKSKNKPIFSFRLMRVADSTLPCAKRLTMGAAQAYLFSPNLCKLTKINLLRRFHYPEYPPAWN